MYIAKANPAYPNEFLSDAFSTASSGISKRRTKESELRDIGLSMTQMQSNN